ncbi:lipopolysaccharide-modifying protein [Biscogniauxia sp. FL1348]|nr:lipopolysaccharide-modifying protein [Biscogniauxia sp. FL1348]
MSLQLCKNLFVKAVRDRRLRYFASVTLSVILIYFVLLARRNETYPDVFRHVGPHKLSSSILENHPITRLVRDAQLEFKKKLGKRSLTLEQAASRYRERRGRHPPPGFDTWFRVAHEQDAVIVEDYFDRIYHDINPFWAFNPLDLRRMIQGQLQYIRVRDGQAWYETDDIEHRQPWVQRWTELVQDMMPHLPDLDMVLNVMDETRVLVPWETMSKYVTREQQTRHVFSPDEAMSDYTGYDDSGDGPAYDPGWIRGETGKYWDHYRVTCPPSTPGRNISSLPDFDSPIDPIYPSRPMPFALDGFVQNFTAAADPCLQPHLRGMHGTFIESVSMATTHDLYPIFGGCKLPGNSDIVIPGGMLLDSYDLFSGGNSHGGAWSKKKTGLIWRGVASGGRNTAKNWWRFQRHRFVQMMNGTTVTLAEQGHDVGPIGFNLSSVDRYKVQAHLDGRLGAWLDKFSDAGFIDLNCHPLEKDGTCAYTSPYMKVVDKIPMKRQYDYKFLPDVDGNSYSARFRGFMRSTSLPLKATVYAEWHDDRLVPWAHFVPLDNTFADVYAVLEYFTDGHDAVAQRIAEEGRAWAEKVMRREDMMLYVWRLLLEYARVMDPKRDRLAFVGDLVG